MRLVKIIVKLAGWVWRYLVDATKIAGLATLLIILVKIWRYGKVICVEPNKPFLAFEIFIVCLALVKTVREVFR